jgi:hypothetical protein
MTWNSRVIEVLLAIALVVGAVAYIDHKNSAHEALLMAQVKQQNAANQQLVQQLQTQNATLTQSIIEIQKTAVQAKIQVLQLPPTQLAADTQKDIGVGTVAVSTTNPGTFNLDTPAMQQILRQIIQGEADARTVTDQQTIIANDKKELAAKDATIKNYETVVVPQLKAEIGRGKRKWFAIGVVVGFLGRVLTHA